MIMIRSVVQCAVGVVMLAAQLWAVEPAEAAPASPPALARLQHFLDTLQTLEADFVQTVAEPAAGVPATSTGHLSVAKPNYFRWDYATPTQQIIVSDGQEVSYYEPDLKQVTVGQARALHGSPAALLSSGARITKLFTWKIVKSARSGLPSVRLIPKKRGGLRALMITLHPQRDEPLELATHDAMGHRVHFSFRAVRTNHAIEVSRFRFDIPDDVDIIRGGGQASDAN